MLDKCKQDINIIVTEILGCIISVDWTVLIYINKIINIANDPKAQNTHEIWYAGQSYSEGVKDGLIVAHIGGYGRGGCFKKINHNIHVVFKYLRRHFRGISLFWVTVEGRNQANSKKIERDIIDYFISLSSS